jgi:hypothetical protein
LLRVLGQHSSHLVSVFFGDLRDLRRTLPKRETEGGLREPRWRFAIAEKKDTRFRASGATKIWPRPGDRKSRFGGGCYFGTKWTLKIAANRGWRRSTTAAC